MRALLTSPLGLLIGLSLGALGGGGSILAVPVLVYAAGLAPKQASSTSLILVAITSLVGLIPHLRARRTRPGVGLLFGLAGIGGAVLGGHASGTTDPDVLMLAFSGVMGVAAVVMWRRNRVSASDEPAPTAAPRVDVRAAAKVVVAGTAVGLLTGFFGVGGGFVIVPMLVLALGLPMPEAAGTSLIVIIVNSTVALVTRLSAGAIDWSVTAEFVTASLVGVTVGGRLAGRVDHRRLQRWFVGLLAVVTVYTAATSAVAVW